MYIAADFEPPNRRPNSRRLLGVARNSARFSCHPCKLATSSKNDSGVTDKKQRIFRSVENADKKLFIFKDAVKEMLIFE